MMEMRGKSISYASYKKKAKNKEEKELITKIQNLEEKLVEENIPKVEELKQQLNTINEEKCKAIWSDPGQILLKMVKNHHIAL